MQPDIMYVRKILLLTDQKNRSPSQGDGSF